MHRLLVDVRPLLVGVRHRVKVTNAHVRAVSASTEAASVRAEVLCAVGTATLIDAAPIARNAATAVRIVTARGEPIVDQHHILAGHGRVAAVVA